MINRYVFEAYLDGVCIYQLECRSLNQVARTRDCFYDSVTDKDLWFDAYDIISNESIDLKELMRIWHGKQIFD